MKKYLILIFCLVFVVSFVCCDCSKKNSSRTPGQFENLDGSLTIKSSASQDSPASDVSRITDSTDKKLTVLYVGKSYDVTTSVVGGGKSVKLTIKDPESGAEESVELNIVINAVVWNNSSDDEIKANAKEVPIRIEGAQADKKIFAISWCNQTRADRIFCILYYSEDISFFKSKTFGKSDEGSMGTLLVPDGPTKRKLHSNKKFTPNKSTKASYFVLS
ncbi:MAG: hypothetical protein LBD17_03590 [Endomicrobium sp.]|jgi:hypothetical protein|nr:hypothetical protein [Endomicrobium sp.]